MKKLIPILIALTLLSCSTDNLQEATQEQSNRPHIQTTENLIVITLDGLRWQEVFGDADVLNRNYLSQIGNLYGNRDLGNLVNVANRYGNSYPGYHEIFTGNITGITGNTPINSPHNSVFEYINEQSDYKGLNVQVAGMWTFMRGLFRVSLPSTTFPVLTPFQIDVNNEIIDLTDVNATRPDYVNKFTEYSNIIYREAAEMTPLINKYGSSINDNEQGELLMYLAGRKSLQLLKPKVMYFQFSMTDHWGHRNNMVNYIKSAKNVGYFIKDLITTIDSDTQYANNTTILVTTDHGRKDDDIRRHSKDTWFVWISPSTNKGIVNEQKQYYHKQFAQTMANVLGFTYEADHEIAPALDL